MQKKWTPNLMIEKRGKIQPSENDKNFVARIPSALPVALTETFQ